MTKTIGVVIPAHNPRRDFLAQVIEALRGQSLPAERWSLLVVDNRSDPAIETFLDLSWHPNAAIVREEELGLTRARMAGFRRSGCDLVVLVDDDNVLAPDYLEQAARIASAFPFIGTWSGHLEPVYELKAFSLPERLEHLVGCRRVTEALWSNDVHHHASTPWGAGMCIRRDVALEYVKRLDEDPRRRELDLVGGRRTYGGDTDIAYVGCDVGLGKGVFPQLRLRHLIGANRCSEDYLVKVTAGHARSGVLHQYIMTGSVALPPNDLRRRVMTMLRWLAMSQLEKRLDKASREGAALGMRELPTESLRER